MAVVAATWADGRSIWTAYWAVEHTAVFRVEGMLLVTAHIEFCSSPQDALLKTDSSKSTELFQTIPLREFTLKKWLLAVVKWIISSARIFSAQKNQPFNRLHRDLFKFTNPYLEQKIADLIPQETEPEEIVEALYEAIRADKGEAIEDKLLGLPDPSTWEAKTILEMLEDNYLPNQAASKLYDEFWVESDKQIYSTLTKQGMAFLLTAIPSFQNQSSSCNASWLDFCFSTLKLPYNPRKWEAFQAVVRECGWIFIHERTCFICDRPIKLCFDEENRLHSDSEAAIQFADGFDIWVNHGTAIES